jgi:molybdenum cofactor cytidylyltransferase
VIGRAEMAALQSAGIAEIVVARLEPGDVSEDVAAAEIASATAGEGVRVDRAFTGRANLFSETAGVLVVNKTAIDALNLIDEAVTFATLPAFKPVVAGEMIATVKIIPFAVAGALRDAAVAVARTAAPLVKVAPYRIRKVGVISTMLPGLATKVIEKTLRVTTERLAPAGAAIVAERRVPHDKAALTQAVEEVLREGAELVIVFGASAIADGATSSRPRSRRSAARWRISACRSIRAICCCSPMSAAGRCSGRRAARARPRKTDSIGF